VGGNIFEDAEGGMASVWVELASPPENSNEIAVSN
jgi:hypothetical protein